MKKLLLVLALAGLGTTAMAQWSEVPTSKRSVVTNRFGANWFITIGGGMNAAYSSQASGLPGSPFCAFRRNWGGEIAFGKWFTPGIGVRIKGSGLWYKQVNGVDQVGDCPTIKTWDIQAQTLFNLHNLIGGYKWRVWNITPYFGFGLHHYMAHEGSYNVSAVLGLINTFNVTKRFFINIDLYAQTMDSNADGDDTRRGNRFLFGMRDNKVGAIVSLGLNIGKVGWEKAPDVAAINALHAQQMAALNEQLGEQEAENERLKGLLANKPEPEVKEVVKTIREFKTAPISVFFNLDCDQIASRRDMVNVRALAELAKEEGRKIVVSGYADSKTGKADYNQGLSMRRANRVADELVKLGISRDDIIIEAGGGVDAISPYPYNRRVILQLK